MSCGIGTGTYSNSYALGIGCASKVNERVNINFGGSYISGGSKDYGADSLDNVLAKAGFIFKIGNLNKPSLISMKEKKALETQVGALTTENQEMKILLALQNERLDKLEKITQKRFRR